MPRGAAQEIATTTTKKDKSPPPKKKKKKKKKKLRYIESYSRPLFFFFFFFFFLLLFPPSLFSFIPGPHLWHKEVPRPGVKLELQLLACATAPATSDLSHICDSHHSLQQHQVFNPLSKAGNQTHIHMNTGWLLNLLSHSGNSLLLLLSIC